MSVLEPDFFWLEYEWIGVVGDYRVLFVLDDRFIDSGADNFSEFLICHCVFTKESDINGW